MIASIRCERAASATRRQLSDACLAVCYSHSSMDLQSGATLCAHHRWSSFWPSADFARRILGGHGVGSSRNLPGTMQTTLRPTCGGGMATACRSRKESEEGVRDVDTYLLASHLERLSPCEQKSALRCKASRMSVENAADLQTIRRASMMVAILGRCASGFSRRDSPSPSSDHHVNIGTQP